MASARDFEVGPVPSMGMTAKRSSKINLMEASKSHNDGEERPEYASNIELLLTLVGYAVGLGNIWRFPYLAYSYGGGTFLIPYFVCLMLLGLPLFILEMGLGQMFRQGTLGVWAKMGQPHLAGVGVAATICTFLVSLYYNVILAWTIYYLYRTVIAIPSGILPWSDQAADFTGCPPTTLFPLTGIHDRVKNEIMTDGFYNKSKVTLGANHSFWCPTSGIPTADQAAAINVDHPGKYTLLTIEEGDAKSCPARAAAIFWSKQALWQGEGFSDIFNFEFHWGLVASLTLAWILVYFIIFKGVQSSGKVVYVTALLPYVALIAFFFRAITLPGAGVGLSYYILPKDSSILFTSEVWIRAATQIFYSLGVGFGSLIAFASYSSKSSDFAKQSTQVAFINCGTSLFAGFVVFPILGFLCQEMSDVNPCIEGNDLSDLTSIGLSGTGLAFIAFPIAISRMGFGVFFWALLFFLMLFCLGIDSQFAMVESVMTVIHDAKIGGNLPKSAVCGIVCGVSWVLGIFLFTTRAGLYWFNLFDYYTCVVAMFFVTIMECLGMMLKKGLWDKYAGLVKENTGRELGKEWTFFYTFLCPILIGGLLLLAMTTMDLMGAKSSVALKDGGSGLYPTWSIGAGWFLGLVPIFGFVAYLFGSMGQSSAPPGGIALAAAQSERSARAAEVEMS